MTTTVHDRFQVVHNRDGLVSAHKSMTLASAAADRYLIKLHKENDSEVVVEIFDLMAKPGHVETWRVTLTSCEPVSVKQPTPAPA